MKLDFDWELSLYRLGLGAYERWQARRRPHGEPVSLIRLERRLTLVMRAVSGRPLMLQPSEGWGYTDGVVVALPPTIDLLPTAEDNTRLYRLCAWHKAAHIGHGGLAAVADLPRDRLRRDLYALVEGVRLWRLLAHEMPGFGALWAPLQPALLVGRPQPKGEAALALETLVQLALGIPPAEIPHGPGADVAQRLWERLASLPVGWSPAVSLDLTDTTARQLETLHGRYRPVPALPVWGEVMDPAVGLPATGIDAGDAVLPDDPDDEESAAAQEELPSNRRIRSKEVATPEQDADKAILFNRFEQVETAEDYFGMARPFDEEGDMQEYAKVLDDLELDKVVRTTRKAKSLYRAELELDATAARHLADAAAPPAVQTYGEWFESLQAYKENWCWLTETEQTSGPEAWATEVLREHAWTLANLKRRFQALRPDLARISRQKDGEEADVDALVTARADMTAGLSPSEHLYISRRRIKRDLAVAFLVDCSASTDAWVLDKRVLDLEKAALLLLGEAMSGQGDRFAMYGFSSKTRKACRVHRIKRFDEPFASPVKQRIAGMEPRDYTRMGAPIRHVVAQLAKVPAARRLLILVCDGKPNDFDVYEGRHGIADVRKALDEARSAGVQPFGVTIDSHGRRYLPPMFGPNGYLVVDDVRQLPRRLPEAILRLIG
jgi:nitric oxide reductase NorD protein